MNLKERIIRGRIARLDPEKEQSLIRKLESGLSRPSCPAPPSTPAPEVKETPAVPSPRRPLTQSDVEDFRSLKAEVHICSKKHGDIYLVPERSGAPRFEILPEEILLLSRAGEAFGAKVVEVRRNVPARL